MNGKNAAPLYKFLKLQKGGIFGDGIKWNFTKFLVAKDGKVVERYAPTTSPLKIEVLLLHTKLLLSSLHLGTMTLFSLLAEGHPETVGGLIKSSTYFSEYKCSVWFYLLGLNKWMMMGI